ncbi:MFS transporter [Lentibacillus sp. N15]|uniref:MFS transporter n=1 Tax=Lentibacillus songyuanensis TaxID=3136161 RepID=UPI0031B9DED0
MSKEMVMVNEKYKNKTSSQVGLLAALLGGIFLGNVDTAIVNIATPSIHSSLHATSAELILINSGYALTYAALLITSARLGSIHGYRRMFLYGLSFFTLASMFCGIAPNAIVLVIARLIQGVGAALMISQVLTGIQLNFEGKARTHALSAYTIVLAGSAAMGQVLGGVLISANLFNMGWRPIFLINVPLGILFLGMAARFLPENAEHKSQRLDLKGVVVLTLALLLLVVPLTFGQNEGWPMWVWNCLVGSALAFALFIVMEHRFKAKGGYPVINLRLFTQPSISLGLFSQFVISSVYYAILFVLALYLQQGLGKSPTYSGLALVPWVAAFGIGGPVIGKLSARNKRLMIPIASFVFAISFAGICVSVLAGAVSGTLLIILLGLGGLSFGIEFTGMVDHLTSEVDKRDASDMSGLLNTTMRLASVFGVAIFGTVYFGLVPVPGRSIAIHGFIVITIIFAISGLVATLVAWLSINYRRHGVKRQKYI